MSMSLSFSIRREQMNSVHSEISLCEALDNYIRLEKFSVSVASKFCSKSIPVYETVKNISAISQKKRR